MPSYADSLSVTQLLDLVAYLKSLTDGAGGHHHGGAAEQAVADYTVRLAYEGTTPGHLMVFVTDLESGEPVPYLPVTATLSAADMKPRMVRLVPMVGAHRFHYGAGVTVPDETEKGTGRLAKPQMQDKPSRGGRRPKA